MQAYASRAPPTSEGANERVKEGVRGEEEEEDGAGKSRISIFFIYHQIILFLE